MSKRQTNSQTGKYQKNASIASLIADYMPFSNGFGWP